ncbi:MAG: hydrogenase maturation protease [Lewinellaceae bacterium]|nr:hydrogenase maturation protease [Lewinellaceae bacterium]
MKKQLLLIGIGNDERADDGLGWRFLDRAAALNLPGCQLEYRYQLAVEDSETIDGFKKVLFIDATQEKLPEGFRFRTCEPDPLPTLYTHQQTPQAVLYLDKLLHDKIPDAWVLEIQGENWELGEKLSKTGNANLEKAWTAFHDWLAKHGIAIPLVH